MTQPPDELLLTEIEAHATKVVREAGAILARYFGTALDIDYKGRDRREPVSIADRESEQFIREAVASRFPDHAFLGEETESEDEAAQEFVWAVDPLDGTRNFVNGLPVYACSVGVMYQGTPIVGAVYVTWPREGGGATFHAHRGGGAFMDDSPITLPGSDEPTGDALAALPGSFGARYGFRDPMRGKMGEIRVTGSIAYELATTARGVFQYLFTATPRIWDVAGGVVLVAEAGGLALVGQRQKGIGSFLKAPRWEPLESFVPSWQTGVTTMMELRRWSEPVVAGSPGIARCVASNMRTRLLLRRRIARIAGRIGRRS